ncbi:MAG: OmpA family protein [Desmonostoc geniculatum HA4340-LM1]|jgi:outer membrane protein OmpA-like peptidoglycan-associated protein|nr:OmpA family protein [Desmonostoc geniculatum HA4340-LM1]
MSDIYRQAPKGLRTSQRKKSTASNFTNPSLASPNIPTLANPIRSFGSQINTTVPQTVTEVAPDLQEAQSADEQSLEPEAIEEKPLTHDISRIPLRRPQAKLTIQRAPRGTTPDASAPEQTAIEITGRYEAIDPDGDNRFTLQINQAGRHFEGWQQRRRYRRISGQRLISQRLTGTLVSSSTEQVVFSYQRFTTEGGTTYEGRFIVRADGTATRSEDNGWSQDFRRTSTAARLSDEAIAATPEETRPLVEATETAPLDSEEEARLERGCGSIRSLIEMYLDATRQNIVRDAYASRINSHVNSLMRPHAPEQMPLVRRRIQEHLLRETFESGAVTRPYWDWLQVVVSAHPTYTESIQNRLGMRADGISGEGAPQHRYRWMFSTVGLSGDAGIGLGGFLGVFVIEKLAPDQWRQKYFTVMGGASGGLSIGVTVGQTVNWSEFETPFPWTSGNFRGAYVITGAGGAGSAGIGGGYTPEAMISFYGDGSFPVLAGDASGFAAVYGAYLGAELSVTSGYLWGGREEAIRNAQHQEVTSQSNYSADTRVHFEVDDPSLTDLGRERIRQMCATHRAAFTNPNSALHIYGYTSTTASAQRNQLLSDLRAQNVLQAIYDVLGESMAIPPANQDVRGFGEQPALDAGIPDRTEDEAWRKVDVQLNGQTIITLR